MFGIEWLFKTWKYVREDYVDQMRQFALIAPISRSPMDKKSAEALTSYAKDVDRMLQDMAPWRKDQRSRRRALRHNVKPGEVVVVLERGESAKHPLYANATIRRRE